MIKRFLVLLVLLVPSAALCAGGGHYTSRLPVTEAADLLLQDGVATLDVEKVAKALADGANPNIPKKGSFWTTQGVGGKAITFTEYPIMLDLIRQVDNPKAVEIIRLLILTKKLTKPAVVKKAIDSTPGFREKLLGEEMKNVNGTVPVSEMSLSAQAA